MQHLHNKEDDFDLEAQGELNAYQIQVVKGTRTFQKMFALWMDSNGWSHPVMTSLASNCIEGNRWFHSSQITGFRQQKLGSPGPRIFLTIERLNYYLWLYREKGTLLPGTRNSNNYSKPFVITEDGLPPSVGWWVEVFLGVRTPKDIDLNSWNFSDDKAAELSKKFGRLVRMLLGAQGIDLVEDLARTIKETYPATEDSRVKKLSDVIKGLDDGWAPEELELELPALAAMTKALGGPKSESELVTYVS